MRWLKAAQVLCLAATSLHCGGADSAGGSAISTARQDRVAVPGVILPPSGPVEAPGAFAAGAVKTNPATKGVDRPSGTNACQQANLASSRYVTCNADGTLAYPEDEATGTKLLDFSAVGYHGGDDALPAPPIHQYLAPSGKDDTVALQTAINAVGARAADANGWRGRIVLAPGVFRVNRTLLMAKSGVALEGSASTGPQATTLKLTGSATVLLHVRGAATPEISGQVATIAQLPVPAGANSLVLSNTVGLAVGDLVRITSSRNKAWIARKWGGAYPPTDENGLALPAWGDSLEIIMPRTITAMTGNTITLDSPLPDTLPSAEDTGAMGATVQKLNTQNYLREFGIAHLRLAGRFIRGDAQSPRLLTAMAIENAEDGYVDDVEATDFGAGTLHIGSWTRHLTVQDVRSLRTGTQTGTELAADIRMRGQLNLVQGCASSGNNIFFVTTHSPDAAGPNVVQNYRATGIGAFEPRERWSTGLLLDNVYAPYGSVAFIDRGDADQGDGWSVGQAVAFNSVAGTHNQKQLDLATPPGFVVDQPPEAANYGIGLLGPNHSTEPDEIHFDSAGQPVAPASLWVQQLWQRRGDAGLANVIGPWHLQDGNSGLCVAADVAKSGGYLVLRDCKQKRQTALFDITSRGSVRLAGTNLCMDGGSDRRHTPVTLRTCVEDVEQHWDIGKRGGALTDVQLHEGNGDEAGCLTLDNKLLVINACTEASASFRLVPTHLAR